MRILRSPYNYDVREVGRSCALHTGTETKVLQSAKDDADINVIVKRFGVTGVMPFTGKVPLLGDFTEITDYRSAMEMVRSAAEAFMALPADVRERFQNDPQAFIEFASKPENLEELRKLGLADKISSAHGAPEGSDNVDGKHADSSARVAGKASGGESGADAGGSGGGAPPSGSGTGSGGG